MAKPKIDLNTFDEKEDPEKEDKYRVLKQYLRSEVLDDDQQRATLEQAGKIMPATLPRAKNKCRIEDIEDSKCKNILHSDNS